MSSQNKSDKKWELIITWKIENQSQGQMSGMITSKASSQLQDKRKIDL